MKAQKETTISPASKPTLHSGVSQFRLLLALTTISYWLATSFLHLEISNIIVSPTSTPLGTFTPAEHASTTAWVLLVGLVAFIAFRAKRGVYRGKTLLCWFLWFALVYAVNKTLVFSPNEYIHYPQYAILTIFMVLWLDPKRTRMPFWRILFWATLMGIFDERRGGVYYVLTPIQGLILLPVTGFVFLLFDPRTFRHMSIGLRLKKCSDT